MQKFGSVHKNGLDKPEVKPYSYHNLITAEMDGIVLEKTVHVPAISSSDGIANKKSFAVEFHCFVKISLIMHCNASTLLSEFTQNTTGTEGKRSLFIVACVAVTSLPSDHEK